MNKNVMTSGHKSKMRKLDHYINVYIYRAIGRSLLRTGSDVETVGGGLEIGGCWRRV